MCRDKRDTLLVAERQDLLPIELLERIGYSAQSMSGGY